MILRVAMLQIVQQAIITDKPVYAYRGILIDTSRNFIPVPALKRLIDGLSYNKLNFFHWHITDSHSFPFESKSRPLVSDRTNRPKPDLAASKSKRLVWICRWRNMAPTPGDKFTRFPKCKTWSNMQGSEESKSFLNLMHRPTSVMGSSGVLRTALGIWQFVSTKNHGKT